MKIIDELSRYRNDFSATVECEHCGRIALLRWGYHDAFFHSRVMPATRCAGCGKDRAGNTEHTDDDVTPTTL